MKTCGLRRNILQCHLRSYFIEFYKYRHLPGEDGWGGETYVMCTVTVGTCGSEQVWCHWCFGNISGLFMVFVYACCYCKILFQNENTHTLQLYTLQLYTLQLYTLQLYTVQLTLTLYSYTLYSYTLYSYILYSYILYS